MLRPKNIPDETIFSAVTAALITAGDKAVSFGTIAAACGLAPSTLALRFGGVEGMIRAAIAAEWRALADATTAAELDAMASAKGAQGMLKALTPLAPALLAISVRDGALRGLAEAWRAQVEAALVPRLGGGAKGREAAAMVFAAWQGRQIWAGVGQKPFRLGDLLKRLD